MVKSEICDAFSPFYRGYFFHYVQRTLCHCEASTGDPAGYCVPVGKRRTQAKGKQLSLATIVWSKAQCATRTLGFFRTRREKHNLIKILTFNRTNNIILAFYDELLKHPFGCFCFGEIFITRAKHYVIPSEAWESPGTDTLLNKAVPFREMRRTTSLLKSHYRGR